MLSFEWDEGKALTNRRKHGVSFTHATSVFFDPHHVDVGRQRNTLEFRFHLIGLAEMGVLFVAYTTRCGLIRIISAREATRHETTAYWTNRVLHARC